MTKSPPQLYNTFSKWFDFMVGNRRLRVETPSEMLDADVAAVDDIDEEEDEDDEDEDDEEEASDAISLCFFPLLE